MDKKANEKLLSLLCIAARYKRESFDRETSSNPFAKVNIGTLVVLEIEPVALPKGRRVACCRAHGPNPAPYRTSATLLEGWVGGPPTFRVLELAFEEVC